MQRSRDKRLVRSAQQRPLPARLIKAEAEQEASMKLAQAAQEIASSPAALELRRMQMVAEVGVEHNTTTILLLPSDFLALANVVTNRFNEESRRNEHSG